LGSKPLRLLDSGPKPQQGFPKAAKDKKLNFVSVLWNCLILCHFPEVQQNLNILQPQAFPAFLTEKPRSGGSAQKVRFFVSKLFPPLLSHIIPDLPKKSKKIFSHALVLFSC